jgi:uncharacterized protein (DUF58 family)
MTGAGASPRGQLVDPKALMAVRNLELRARVVVEGLRNGLHRSPWHGFSAEFTEYRQYTPGDDIRRLDWRVYARSDRHFIKKFEDETNLRCWLMIDRSRSMNYGSAGVTKRDYAATLAATLALFLDLQGDAVGMVAFDDAIREFLPARRRPGHLRRLLHGLEAPASGPATRLAPPLDQLAPLIRKRGLIVLISDLLAPVGDFGRRLSALAAMGHEAALFQILDPAEVSLELGAPSMMEDLETGRLFHVDPSTARRDYRRRLEEHQGAVREACRRCGVELHVVATDTPLELALVGFLEERARHRTGGGRW